MDPRLEDHKDNETNQAIVDIHDADTQSKQSGSTKASTLTQTSTTMTAETDLSTIMSSGAETLQGEILDPVETLRARCSGWYLTKWFNWEDEDNEWRKPHDLPSEMVAEYDATFKGNSFGVLIGKRRRQKVIKGRKEEIIEYQMQWTGLSLRKASWLPAIEIDEGLIKEFEENKSLSKSHPRRKRRRKV
ncbi:hypothetical protein V8C42DRAFT_338658 [Trichoderma barbatum]